MNTDTVLQVIDKHPVLTGLALVLVFAMASQLLWMIWIWFRDDP